MDDLFADIPAAGATPASGLFDDIPDAPKPAPRPPVNARPGVGGVNPPAKPASSQAAVPVSRDAGDIRPPSRVDVFENESFGDLAARRGQQAAAGATEAFAAVPEGLELLNRQRERVVNESSSEVLPQLMKERDELEAILSEMRPKAKDGDWEAGARVKAAEQRLFMVNGQIQMAARMKDDSGRALSQPVEDTLGFQAGAALRKASENVVGKPDERDQSFWGRFAYGAGNVAGRATTAVAGALVGGAPLALTAGGVQGATMNSSQIYKEAIAAGADEETALEASNLGFAVGLSEILPLSRALKIIGGDKVANTLLRKAIEIGKNAGEEALQEFGAQVANNMIAQGYYDPERGTFQGAGESALMGVILGGATGTVGQLAQRGNRNQQDPAKPTVVVGETTPDQSAALSAAPTSTEAPTTSVAPDAAAALGASPRTADEIARQVMASKRQPAAPVTQPGNAPAEEISPTTEQVEKPTEQVAATGPEAAGDTIETVPEAPATIENQNAALVDPKNKRKAVFIPNSSYEAGEVDEPEGKTIGRVVLPEGILFFNKAKGYTSQDVRALYKSGRLGTVLGLGEFNKADVAKSAAQGSPELAVTERTPDGTEVKAAAGTTETAPDQLAALEADKTPGNTVQVEEPAAVIADRLEVRQETAAAAAPAPAPAPVPEPVAPPMAPAAVRAKADLEAAEAKARGVRENAIRSLAPEIEAMGMTVEEVLAKNRGEQQKIIERAKKARSTPAKAQAAKEVSKVRDEPVTSEGNPEAPAPAAEPETPAPAPVKPKLTLPVQGKRQVIITDEKTQAATKAYNDEIAARAAEANKKSTDEKVEERTARVDKVKEDINKKAYTSAGEEAEARGRAGGARRSKDFWKKVRSDAEIAADLLKRSPEEYEPISTVDGKVKLIARLEAVVNEAVERGFKFKSKATYDTNTDAVVWLHDAKMMAGKLRANLTNGRVTYDEINGFLMDELATKRGDGALLRERRIAAGNDTKKPSGGAAIENVADTSSGNESAETVEDIVNNDPDKEDPAVSTEDLAAQKEKEAPPKALPATATAQDDAEIGARVTANKRSVGSLQSLDESEQYAKQLEKIGMTPREWRELKAEDEDLAKEIVEKAGMTPSAWRKLNDEDPERANEVVEKAGMTLEEWRELIDQDTERAAKIMEKAKADSVKTISVNSLSEEEKAAMVAKLLGARSTVRMAGDGATLTTEDLADLIENASDEIELRTFADVADMVSEADFVAALTADNKTLLPREAKLQQTLVREIAKALKKVAAETNVYVLSDADFNLLGPSTNLGVYVKEVDGIYVRESVMEDGNALAHIMLHEGSHAAFEAAIEASPDLKRQLKILRAKAEQHAIDTNYDGSKYGFKDVHEFLSEAWSNPQFQEFLATVPLSMRERAELGLKGPQTLSVKSAIIWLKNAISNVLNIKAALTSAGYSSDTKSTLEAAFDIAGRLLEVAPQARADLAAKIEAGLEAEGIRPLNRIKTDTPAFKKWFGKSKVVTREGSPMAVYHFGSFVRNGETIPNGPMHFGTEQAALDRATSTLPKRMGDAVEVYEADGRWHYELPTGETSEWGEGFANEAEATRAGVQAARWEARQIIENGDPTEFGTVTPVYLSIKNPKRVRDVGGEDGEWDVEIAKAKAEGYDGIIYTNQYEDKGSDSYIAFEPSQIKSVDNQGTFDPANPDIRAMTSDALPKPKGLNARLKERGLNRRQAAKVASVIRKEFDGNATDAQLDEIAALILQESEAAAKLAKAAKAQGAQVKANAEKLQKDALEAAIAEFTPKGNPGRPWLLSLLTNAQIGRVADRFFGQTNNPVRKIAEIIERRRVLRDRYMSEIGTVIEDIMAAAKNHTAKQMEAFETLAHDATMAGVHPDYPLDHKMNAHLGKKAMRGTYGKAAHAELAAAFKALPPELQDLYVRTRDTLTDAQNRMTFGLMRNILNKSGFTDEAMIRRFHEDKATEADYAMVGEELAQHLVNATELKKIKGPYFNLTRRGDHVVRGAYKLTPPGNAKALSENEFEFKDRKDAEAYVAEMAGEKLRADMSSVWVDKNTGERTATDVDGVKVRISPKDVDAEQRFRVKVQNEHVEFVDGRKAAGKLAKELKAAGLEGVYFEKKAWERDAQNAQMLSDQFRSLMVTLDKRGATSKLDSAQKNEMKALMNEVSLRFLGSTRIQSSRLPRRYVQGASKDLVRNTYDYVKETSGYLAKLDTEPQIEAAMQNLEARHDALKKSGTGANEGSRLVVDEIKKRALDPNYGDTNGPMQRAVDRVLRASFIDYLASAGYSIINSLQVATVSLPVLSGEFNPGSASYQLIKAYNDLGSVRVLAGGVVETAKAVGGNKAEGNFVDGMKSRLSEKRERDMLQELEDVGLLDGAGGLEVDRKLDRSPNAAVHYLVDTPLGYLENIVRAMPQAIEAINRGPTALAAYRLMYGRTQDHEKSVQFAKDAVDRTQGNYSASNAAPVFNSSVGRLLLQFKKYGQMIYAELGHNVGRLYRGGAPGERRKAAMTLAYFAAGQQIIAGSLGLPFLEIPRMIFAGLLSVGFDMEWEDFEEEVQKFWTEMTGSETGGEMLTYGVTRGIPGGWGFDLNDRVGMDSLMTFGAPRSGKEADEKAWLFDTIAGPAVATVLDMKDGVKDILSDKWETGLQKLIPLKGVTDTLKAARGVEGGTMNEQDAVLRVLGLTSARQARIATERGRAIDKASGSKDERNKIISDFVNAVGEDERKAAWRRAQEYNANLEEGERKLSKDYLIRLRAKERARYQE